MSAVRDHGLENLLELNGEILVLDENGRYWVKFLVTSVPASPGRPQGLKYSLTLHGPSNERLVGFDNAHRVAPTRRGDPQDHRHGLHGAKAYEYSDAAALLEAFWAEVDKVLRDKGIIT